MQLSDKERVKFSTKDIEIIKKETLFDGFFKMIKYYFKYRRFAGGWSRVVERELFYREKAAAMLPYDPQTDQVVLIEQIRVGALEHTNPWQFEIVAGIIDKQETSEEVVKRESLEESGLVVGRLEKITSYYPSAGGCNEMLDVFVGEINAAHADGIHGLEEEDEDIRVHVVSRAEAYDMVRNGHIENGASIIALQWLELNVERLRAEWRK